MLHARDDYNRRIQDRSEDKGIPKEEPVFLLRAQDPLFIPMLNHYIELGHLTGLDSTMLQMIRVHVERAKLWPVRKTKADI